MSTVKLTPYAERLLSQRSAPPVLTTPRASAPKARDREAVPYCPKRRAEHLRHARLWLAKRGVSSRSAYARTHGLSQTLFHWAVHFAKANPRATHWPRGPIGSARQITDAQRKQIGEAFESPLGHTIAQWAERIGVSVPCINHYFRAFRAGRMTP